MKWYIYIFPIPIFTGPPIAFEEQENITVLRVQPNSTARMKFRSVAYPPPEFSWQKYFNDSWISVANSTSVLVNVSEDRLEFILEIQNIQDSEYGQYKLSLENVEGNLETRFNVTLPGNVFIDSFSSTCKTTSKSKHQLQHSECFVIIYVSWCTYNSSLQVNPVSWKFKMLICINVWF